MPLYSFAAADKVYRLLTAHKDRVAIILTNEDDAAIMRFSFDREDCLTGHPIYPKDTVMLYLWEGDEVDIALYVCSDAIVANKLQYDERVVKPERKKVLLGLYEGVVIG